MKTNPKLGITNSTMFDYQLSIHAAGMLLKGIIDYHESTLLYFNEGTEDSDYCSLRNYTALREAKKLHEFLLPFPNHLVNGMIEDLNNLIEDMSNFNYE
jgi:hypothetical protein